MKFVWILKFQYGEVEKKISQTLGSLRYFFQIDQDERLVRKFFKNS